MESTWEVTLYTGECVCVYVSIRTLSNYRLYIVHNAILVAIDNMY